jgi:hypothetical protein
MRKKLIPVALGAVWLALAGAVFVEAPAPRHSVQAADALVSFSSAAGTDAQLVVTPTFLYAQLAPDWNIEEILTVGNHGSTTLVYTVTVLPAGPIEGIVPWLHVAPTQGSIPPEASVPISATFDAADMFVGLYLANVVVDSDSLVGPAVITVPALLEVVEPWGRIYLPLVSRRQP